MKARTRTAELLTDLILEIFRINGLLLAAGDNLTKDLGLTARWQVMGALADGQLTVSQIARRMGLTRQGVQRLVDVLETERVLELVENPEHKRAKLVRLSEAGREKLTRISEIQKRWAGQVGRGLSPEKMTEAVELLRVLRSRLGKDSDGVGDS